MDAFDLVVIGTGTAAQVASARVRKAGRSVAIIDRLPFGGTCALRGCDPKKMLLSGAEVIDAAHRMRSHGVNGEVQIDWKNLVAFRRTFTDPIPEKRERSFEEQGIRAFHGAARFVAPDAVQVDGQVLRGRLAAYRFCAWETEGKLSQAARLPLWLPTKIFLGERRMKA